MQVVQFLKKHAGKLLFAVNVLVSAGTYGYLLRQNTNSGVCLKAGTAAAEGLSGAMAVMHREEVKVTAAQENSDAADGTSQVCHKYVDDEIKADRTPAEDTCAGPDQNAKIAREDLSEAIRAKTETCKGPIGIGNALADSFNDCLLGAQRKAIPQTTAETAPVILGIELLTAGGALLLGKRRRQAAARAKTPG